MSRWAVLIAAIVFLVGCDPQATVSQSADLDDIRRVRIEAIPEGPPAPPFSRMPAGSGKPLGRILDFIPIPLPDPIPQSCGSGGTLTVELFDGTQISYGPCERPLEIERLWWHILDVLSEGECRPNCWAGGESPPGEWVPPDVGSGTGRGSGEEP